MKHCVHILCLCLLLTPVLLPARGGSTHQSQPDRMSETPAFTRNAGQVRDTEGKARPDILHMLWHKDVGIYTRATGLSYVFRRIDTPAEELQRRRTLKSDGTIRMDKPEDFRVEETLYRVDMELVDANPDPVLLEDGRARGVDHYYMPHCAEGILGVASYSVLTYRDVYDNIDLKIYTTAQGLKYDFLVHPGGDVASIRMRYAGAEGLRLREDGGLTVTSPLGELHEDAPYSYQRFVGQGDEGYENTVGSSFVLRNGEIGFAVEQYDAGQPPDYLFIYIQTHVYLG